MNKKIIYLVVALVFVAAAFFAFNKFLKVKVVESPIVGEVTPEKEAENLSVDNIIVPDQAPGNEIFIEKVSLKTGGTGGFAILYRLNKDNSRGNIIGVSRYLKSGVTENLIVGLNKGETVTVGETVLAILHSDDGDSVWNYEKDNPINDGKGNIVQVTFKIIDDLEDIPGFESKL